MIDNDKLLLEKAAKAAGIELTWQIRNDEFVYNWNPLTDDGDALRLAVKLKMPINFGQTQPNVSCWYEQERYGNGDPYEATRRAIVRAAAHIGESMV